MAGALQLEQLDRLIGVQEDLYTYNANSVPPVIKSITPTSSNSIWAYMSITGSFFEETTEVTIDGEPVPYFSLQRYEGLDDELRFQLPRHAPGKVD
ncbi:MAG: IPT/TIG domain-containing protein, partial [Myxococcales bacterium]